MATSDTLDRYRNVKTLGSGGMGTVTLAEDTMLGRRVALKRLHTTGDLRGISRLRREALVGASLSHPNLVSVYDVLTDEGGDLVVVMEYVPGETLRDAIRGRSGLPVAQAMRVLDGVASGLDAIHQRGIVHRDVKPANILLGTGGAIKLADLGVASAVDRTQITTDGAVLGTFSYMAPEQLEGRTSDPAMDIYALSAVAYEVLSGRKARPEPNPLALAHAISTQPPPDLREVWEQAPEAAAAVLLRGMARDPAQRPRSAGELMARLRAAFDPDTTARSPARSGDRAPPAPPAAPTAPPAPAPTAPPAAAARPVPTAPAAERDAAPPQAAAAITGPTGRQRGDAGRPGAARAASAAPAAAARGPREGERRPAADGRRRGLIVAGLLALAAVIVAVIVVSASGGGTPRPSASASTRHSPAKGTAGASASTSTSTSSSAVAPAATGAAVPSASDPVSTVEAFYGQATKHDYAAAWRLADPAAQVQLGGYSSFVAQQGATRSIAFNQTQVVSRTASSATVAVHTTSVRTDGRHQCTGAVTLVNVAGSWRVHGFQGISCTPP